MDEEQQNAAPATEQPSANPPAEAQKAETPAEQTVPYARFKEVNERLKMLESEATKQAKAQQQAEDQRKVEAGEWQKVAEERKARIDELSSKSELAERLSDIVGKQLEAEIATWPESVRAIMPNAESALLDRLEWAERTRPLAKELMAAQATPPPTGTPYPRQHPGGGNGIAPKDLAAQFLQKQNEQAAARPNPLLKK